MLWLSAGCGRHKPVIYLDNEWSEYYAKNTCYLTMPKGNRDPGLEPCVARQSQALDSFERALLPQLGGAHPACAGVTIGTITADRPPASTGFWRLLISLDDPEGKREPWDLMAPEGPKIHHGAGAPPEISQAVCDIASGGRAR